jgi:hypothetical protein
MWFDPAQLAKAKPRPPATIATSAAFQAQKPMQGAKVAIVAKVASLEIPKTATASTWWLVHYLDGAPVEVWISPPATHAEILASRPDAIAAEPFEYKPKSSISADIAQPEPVPAQASCSTCTNVTGRSGCGEPEVAGLSDVVGVICYSPDQGATCPAWLGSIPSDLETLIQRSGAFYEYGPEDFQLIRQVARFDPDGLRLALNYFQ